MCRKEWAETQTQVKPFNRIGATVTRSTAENLAPANLTTVSLRRQALLITELAHLPSADAGDEGEMAVSDCNLPTLSLRQALLITELAHLPSAEQVTKIEWMFQIAS